MNKLDEMTSKSITNFSIDTAQNVLEMLKRINNGETINYNSILSQDDEDIDKENVSLIDDIKDKQDSVINLLLREGIKYEIIDDKVSKLDSKGKILKFNCVIFNNADQFIRLIKNAIVSSNEYILYLHTNFIEKDIDCYRLYYNLYINRLKTENKDIKNEVCNDNNIVFSKAIINEVIDHFKDIDYLTQYKLIEKYRSMLKDHTLEEVINIIKNENRGVS